MSSIPSLSTEHEGNLKPSRLDFPVVGMGASAGGIPALQAFVAVLHLSPRHASNLNGVGRPGDARRAIAAGFAAHQRKPVTLDKLLLTLREALPPRGE